MSARIQVVLFGPEGRGSFNEAGHAGALRARNAGHDVAVTWIADPDPQARAAALLALCETAPELIVAHGGQGDYPVSVAAACHPARRFVVTQGSVLSANTASYAVLQEQSAFLAGVLAATDTRTEVVAHLSGEKVRPGLKGRAAFLHGVRSAVPGLPALTTRHLDVFLASAVADSGLCVEQAIADLARDRIAWGTVRAFGLEAPAAVRLALGRDVSQAARAALDDWSQRLLDGSVVVDDDYEGAEFAAGETPAAA